MTGANRPDSTRGCFLSGNSRATVDNRAQAGFQPVTRNLCCERKSLLFPINVFFYLIVKMPQARRRSS